jgi:hypothetical protein
MGPTVLLSCPALLTNDQNKVLDLWTRDLGLGGLAIERLSRQRYAHEPWQQLRSEVNRIDGLVACGFRQLGVLTGHWRARTEEERDAMGWHWTTPWVQIEVGMAAMAGAPILAVPEPGVSEGIFSVDVWTGLVFGATMADGPRAPEVRRWRRQVEHRFSGRSRAGGSPTSTGPDIQPR